MSGQWERGSTLLKRLAAELIEKDDPQSTEQAEKIYMKLMETVFEGDNFMMNGDLVTSYIKLLMK
eukprot:CAMPEP_0116873342 /NCGR_PEP_ID=MMETSP0463-20121206/4386_1 /TAXON_ID=181622 /ORGANISM="Strombidinopsis sp, Strain SopsisLIS2011" /LENGTH=64 /DNA_ID=CAMNT_0004515055 /DNA_START=260 /DNA_END=454 /DNA_ORIENTATION=+